MTITEQTAVGELAAAVPQSVRVFQRHGLDFCCHGHVAMAEACRARALDLESLRAELAAEEPAAEDFERWDERPQAELIEHVLARYHARHRDELPRLLALARKVEGVHAARPDCPRGLAAHLGRMAEELEWHMQKEEQVLFPLLLAGRGRMAGMPIQAMEREHEDHGRNLARLRALAHDYRAPADGCGSWHALYLGLAELERELMQHIHLENNVLFPRALRG